jgi:uncharacterized membrane protein
MKRQTSVSSQPIFERYNSAVQSEREQVFKELRADKRYTVDPEFTGRTTRCWVARFCGEWLSRHDQQWQA